MAKLIKNHIPHPKYEVYRCVTLNRNFDDVDGVAVESYLFRVKLYLIFAEGKVYTFYDPSSWIDTVNLMRDSGTCCSTFTHDIFCSPTDHRDIYKEIMDYVSKTD